MNLLRDHRLGRLSGGYGVCVAMDDLPGASFGSKDHRNPQSDWVDIFPSAYLGLPPFHSHNVGKLRSYVLRYDLGAMELAIPERRCGTVRSRSNLLPSSRGGIRGY